MFSSIITDDGLGAEAVTELTAAGFDVDLATTDGPTGGTR